MKDVEERVARALFQRDVEEDVCDGTWEENEALHPRILADARAAINAAHSGVEMLLSDAFDRGFKAAGGTMIPDGARDMVELALSKATINALADAAEYVCHENFAGREFESDRALLQQFLENISIYRRRT